MAFDFALFGAGNKLANKTVHFTLRVRWLPYVVALDFAP